MMLTSSGLLHGIHMGLSGCCHMQLVSQASAFVACRKAALHREPLHVCRDRHWQYTRGAELQPLPLVQIQLWSWEELNIAQARSQSAP